MNKLSVIMSVYKNDRLALLKQAIESILNQTYKDFDLYLMFDGPVIVDVADYLHSVAKEDKRMIISERIQNMGLAHSLNDLLKNVMAQTYDYIARMDADDISLPERFQRQVDYLEEHRDVDCLGTWAIEITNDGNEYFRKQMPITHEECLEQFKKRDCMIHPTVIFRRSYIEKAGFYALDTYFGEDTMMWANGFANGCKLENLPEYLFKFRLDDNFFERRRGWKHAINIFRLRTRVNRMLHFGFKSNVYAFLYATAKMMPKSILNLIYRVGR